eukprot:TRINITY_DN78354_c0_g1_i1.p1 TRINITY_DN78354_c0_g1~~TRINITY_DN78354_c0_g1_i1.p1  ORF type:complete len:334 (+),score=84.82 TRINITY_DN78354_c0_g1_i1:69-1004(+)
MPRIREDREDLLQATDAHQMRRHFDLHAYVKPDAFDACISEALHIKRKAPSPKTVVSGPVKFKEFQQRYCDAMEARLRAPIRGKNSCCFGFFAPMDFKDAEHVVARAAFEKYSKIRSEDFKTIVRGVFKLCKLEGEPSFPAQLKSELSWHEYAVAYRFCIKMSQVIQPKSMEAIFTAHAVMKKQAFVDLVTHEVEMEEGILGELPDVPAELDYHHFVNAYEAAHTQALERMPNDEIEKVTTSKVISDSFSSCATMSQAAFISTVTNQLEMLGFCAPANMSSIVPAEMRLAEFMATYKKVMEQANLHKAKVK